MSFVDIHCHIMPGVDDGSQDTQMSLEMLRIAASEGVSRVILTPHHKPGHRNVSTRSIIERTKELQRACDDAEIPIRLHTGNELYYYEDSISMIEEKEIAPLAGTDHVLVEFHPMDPYSKIRNAVYELMAIGRVPVIAHVERYAEVVKHPELARELSDMGCLIQVNAKTITGGYGGALKSFVKTLLKDGVVDFVASDAHNTDNRAPRFKEAYRYVVAKTNKEYAKDIFRNNAMHMIGLE